MAAKCSIVPAVVWNWAIEALASSEQVDISTLIGLVKTAPAISGDAGKDTREIISLRILESFFDHGNEATVDAKTPKVSFDSLERCEEVLKKILHETPEQITKLEKEKWDVGPFLKHKRSSLPKCVLKKLKEAILDDSNPLASLKEKSKLVISNASEDTSLANDELPLNPGKDRNKFQEYVLQDDNVPQETCTEGDNRRVSVDSVENLKSVKSKDSSNTVQPNNERTDDEDDDGDERTDVAAKKEAFLKSQCTVSQHSLTFSEWLEIDRCMKCNDSGELLLCSSDSCALRFHESCLGSAVTLVENGEFLCPFCAYSRAISRYQDAKRNVSLARKHLQAFSNFRVKPRPNKSSTEQTELKVNEDRQMGANNINCTSNEEDSAQPDPMIPDVNDDDPPVEQTTELPQNLIPEPSTPNQKCNEKESQRLIKSSLTIRLRKRKAKHAPPSAPLGRRKKLSWTKSEEETLKEGVERYSSGDSTKIPWKEILDFGHNVFHKGRTAIDLKDKWRNICK